MPTIRCDQFIRHRHRNPYVCSANTNTLDEHGPQKDLSHQFYGDSAREPLPCGKRQ